MTPSRRAVVYEKHTGRVLDRKTRQPIGLIVRVLGRWWEPQATDGRPLYDALPTLREAIVEVVRASERSKTP